MNLCLVEQVFLFFHYFHHEENEQKKQALLFLFGVLGCFLYMSDNYHNKNLSEKINRKCQAMSFLASPVTSFSCLYFCFIYSLCPSKVSDNCNHQIIAYCKTTVHLSLRSTYEQISQNLFCRFGFSKMSESVVNGLCFLCEIKSLIQPLSKQKHSLLSLLTNIPTPTNELERMCVR